MVTETKTVFDGHVPDRLPETDGRSSPLSTDRYRRTCTTPPDPDVSLQSRDGKKETEVLHSYMSALLGDVDFDLWVFSEMKFGWTHPTRRWSGKWKALGSADGDVKLTSQRLVVAFDDRQVGRSPD